MTTAVIAQAGFAMTRGAQSVRVLTGAIGITPTNQPYYAWDGVVPTGDEATMYLDGTTGQVWYQRPTLGGTETVRIPAKTLEVINPNLRPEDIVQ